MNKFYKFNLWVSGFCCAESVVSLVEGHPIGVVILGFSFLNLIFGLKDK